MDTTAYFLLRLSIGISLLGHGLVRLPKLAEFSASMVNSFEKSILPKVLVLSFSYALPFAEFALGLLILLGLFTRYALIGAAVLMIMLIFGTTTVEQWNNLPLQLIHVAFFAVLLNFLQANKWALDNVMGRK